MKNKIRIFSTEEKTKIVLELIKEEVMLSQLSSKYEVSSKTIQNWKKQFLANAALAFEPYVEKRLLLFRISRIRFIAIYWRNIGLNLAQRKKYM